MDTSTQIQWVRDGCLDIIKILDSQGSGIDQNLLKNLVQKMKPAISYASDIKHHERRRTMPATNGRDGLVGRRLTGYLYDNNAEH